MVLMQFAILFAMKDQSWTIVFLNADAGELQKVSPGALLVPGAKLIDTDLPTLLEAKQHPREDY